MNEQNQRSTTMNTSSGLESDTVEKPLVTFALFAFNQERFIQEAVEAALSQTYSPLEIYLSDDCSTDCTFELMGEVASKYEGPHKVFIIRNKRNLGIGEHINHIVRISKGELIIGAAGDDISLPHRSSLTVSHWLDRERKPCSLFSKNIVINSAGARIGDVGSKPTPGSLTQKLDAYMEGVLGCSHAWSRKVFDEFGPLQPGTIHEDRVIPFRSELLGGIEFISEPLVKYRVHENNLSHFHGKDIDSVLNMVIELNRRNRNTMENYLADLDTAIERDILPVSEAADIREMLIQKIDESQGKIDFLQANKSTKAKMIRSCMLSDPQLAFRRSMILLFPNLYLRHRYQKPPGAT